MLAYKSDNNAMNNQRLEKQFEGSVERPNWRPCSQ